MVIGFLTFLGVGVGTATAIATAINWAVALTTLAVGVKGYRQLKDMQQQGQAILANKTSAGGKIPVIYGTRRVGAQVIYMDTHNNDSRDLYVVYALAIGECEEILGRTIELDGTKLTDSARFFEGGYVGSDKISSGAGSLNTASQNGDKEINAGAGRFGTDPTKRYMYVLNCHHGAASQTADPMLVASMTNWTSNHRLDGIAYIAAHFQYETTGMWKGVPQLTVQVQGKKVYDPRDSGQTFGTPSTYEWSDNPALCFLDYITNNEYGKGLTSSQINMSTFSSAANVCDTLVDNPYYGDTAQTFTWSGESGDDFISIPASGSGGLSWWQNKIGENFTLYDSDGNIVLNNVRIKDVDRNHYYGEGVFLEIYFKGELTQDYSEQTGTSLAKVIRFHCNGYLDTNKNVMENAKELLANMRGIFLYVNGQYELSIEDTGTSTFSITDDHIISDAGISVDYGNKDKKANKVIIEFFNANKKYELDTATVLHDATPEYYSDDNDEILEIKAEFPYVTDPYVAYNMGKAILVRSRNQTTMQFLGTPEMYKLNVGDIVDLTYTGLGFSGKICRVEALELQPNGLVAVSLIEYFDVYTWEVPPQEPFEELANLPSAYAVKAPTGLAFTDSNISSTGRPILSWDAPTDYPDYEFRVNVVDSSDNQLINKIVNTTEAELNFIPTGSNYVASVTSLNTLGTESNATTLTFTVADEPVAEGDIQANAITANKINVNQLSSISADLGSITGGSINIGSGNFTVDTSGNVVATSITTTGKYNPITTITATGQAGLFSQLSTTITGGDDPLRVLNPSDDSDKDFFILMGDDPYNMAFSSGIPTSANLGLWFTGTGSIYMGGTNDSFSPLADDSNDLGRLNNRWDDVYATNGTIQTSDANDKSNIANSDLGLSFVSQLTPRKYTLNDGDSNRTHYGLIAQEVKTVLDNNNINTFDFAPYIKGEILDTNNEGTGEYKYGLRYTELISILIKAIQELEQRVQDLEN